jgi:hypothetical protein
MPPLESKLQPTKEPNVFIVEEGRAAGEPIEFQVTADGTITGCIWVRAFPYKKIAGFVE